MEKVPSIQTAGLAEPAMAQQDKQQAAEMAGYRSEGRESELGRPYGKLASAEKGRGEGYKEEAGLKAHSFQNPASDRQLAHMTAGTHE